MTLPRRMRMDDPEKLQADLELLSDVASAELKALGDDVRLHRRFRFESKAGLMQDLETLRDEAQASLSRLGSTNSLPRLFRFERLEADIHRFRDILQSELDELAP